MDRKQAVERLKHLQADYNDKYVDYEGTNDAYNMAIEALDFMEKYDAVWESIKYAGEHGQEVEFHRYGRVYRIREVAT